ncbi:MAG: Hsp33 family molecular chaperone HslO, partial [Alkalispirochaeta sp.]
MIQQPYTTPEIAADGMDSYLLAEGTFRLNFVHATELVNRMRANHLLGPGGTVVLGQAYLLALLSAGTLKNEEKIGLSVESSGKLEGLAVDADAHGHVRGYLKSGDIYLPNTVDPATLLGEGTLTMFRYAESMRHPSQGQIQLRTGTLSENVAAYYTESEQIATFLDVDVYFDDEQRVAGAAGILIQSLPGSEPDNLKVLADALEEVRPLGRSFADGATAVQIVRSQFERWNPQLIATRSAEFYCSCSKERFGRFLAAMPPEEQEDILLEGPIPLH